MMHFAALRALGWRDPPAPPPAPARIADPTGDAITGHLVSRGLWRYGGGLSLSRDGKRLSVRVFLPEHQQSDRTIGQAEAAKVREALLQALTAEGYVVRFVDQLFCERGTKGWAVVARAEWRRG